MIADDLTKSFLIIKFKQFIELIELQMTSHEIRKETAKKT